MNDKILKSLMFTPNDKLSKVISVFNRTSIYTDGKGFGVVINTSFNLHGRAMVRSPEDAILDFLACKLDLLFFDKIKVQRL